MELDYVRHFVRLAETENYLEAAEDLFMAQSSLSMHIKSLEKELGAPLFERTTRKVALSDFGKAFLPYARKMLEIQEECSRELRGYLDSAASVISVASIPAMAHYRITDVLAGFQRENPGYRLNVTEADTARIWELLETGKCECGFVRTAHGSAVPEGMKQIPFTADHLVAVLPAAHPLAGEKKVSLGMLKQEKFLFLDRETSMYAICMNACRKAGIEPEVAFTGFRGDNLIDLAAKGMGVALLTRRPIEYGTEKSVALVDIEPSVVTEVCLVYSGKRKLPHTVKRFIDYVKKTKDKL